MKDYALAVLNALALCHALVGLALPWIVVAACLKYIGV